MDMEFDKVVEKMPTVEVNTTAVREHVGEIEGEICFIKERCRDTRSLMPFEQVPKAFIIHLVHFCVMWINPFPAKKGISKRLSPQEILLR